MTPPITQLVEYWKEYKEERAFQLKQASFEGFMRWLERKVK